MGDAKKGNEGMSDATELSETKRALLEKYLQGELPQAGMIAHTLTRHTKESPVLSSLTDSRISLVPIQTGGARRPFFYLHVHWQGGAFYCFPLAHDLGSDRPFYVVDPYKFDGLPVPPTIEAMAAAYLESIRTVQPEGPYLLGGFCGGGLIAYEIAQQVRAQGQAVDKLVLIDPMAGSIQLIRLIGGLFRCIGGIIQLGPGKQLDWFLRLRYVSRILRRARDENSEHVDRLLRSWLDKNPWRFPLIPAAEALRQDWMGIFIWAVSGYIPRQYLGRVAYFFAGERPAKRSMWWGEVTESEKVEVHVIPGTHETCRTLYLHDLAEQLRICLGSEEYVMNGLTK